MSATPLISKKRDNNFPFGEQRQRLCGVPLSHQQKNGKIPVALVQMKYHEEWNKKKGKFLSRTTWLSPEILVQTFSDLSEFQVFLSKHKKDCSKNIWLDVSGYWYDKVVKQFHL